MSRPAIQNIRLTEHLTLSECHTINWWLYDERAGINVGMRAATPFDAFVEAIEYWAKRATKVEHAYVQIKGQVDTFVTQFVELPDEDD